MNEKTERYLITQIKVASAIRTVAAWIFCLSFLSFIGGGVCGIIGMCYGYRIAAYKAGFDFTGFELDKDYYEAQEKRFKTFTDQLVLI